MSAQILRNEADTGATTLRASAPAAWRVLGWFGLLLALIGLADALINWYPMGWSSPEWEFSTIATTFGALPLVTMGFAAVLGSALARGSRAGVIVTGVVLLVLALLVLGLLVIFASDIPLALRAAAGSPAAYTIKRGIARTLVLGVGFGVGYLAAAILSFRHLRKRAHP